MPINGAVSAFQTGRAYSNSILSVLLRLLPRLLLSETTSHPTKQPKNGCKVVAYNRTNFYCLHPQALKVRNLLWAQAHEELSGVDADKSATTMHCRSLVTALQHFQIEVGIMELLALDSSLE